MFGWPRASSPSVLQMTRFDSGYYARFYGKDGAHDEERIHYLATAVHNMCSWWGITIDTVFDIGAGMGMWRDWYNTNHPDVRVRSIDVSAYACETWGHERRNIAEWKPREKFDLVICHSVLQYLDNTSFVDAVHNIAHATRYVLYLELPTKADYENIVDPKGTDLQVFHRSSAWYRKHLSEHFTQVGAGLWIKTNSVPMYELEVSR